MKDTILDFLSKKKAWWLKQPRHSNQIILYLKVSLHFLKRNEGTIGNFKDGLGQRLPSWSLKYLFPPGSDKMSGLTSHQHTIIQEI